MLCTLAVYLIFYLLIDLDPLAFPEVFLNIPERRLANTELFPFLGRHLEEHFSEIGVVVPVDFYQWNAKL